MTKGETSERRRNCHAPAHSLSRKPLPPQHQHLSLAINSLINLDLKELFFNRLAKEKRNLSKDDDDDDDLKKNMKKGTVIGYLLY